MQQVQLGMMMEVAKKRLSVEKAKADLQRITASSSTSCLLLKDELLAPKRTSSNVGSLPLAQDHLQPVSGAQQQH